MDQLTTRAQASFDQAVDSQLREAHHRIANDLMIIAGMLRVQGSMVRRGNVTLSPEQAVSMLTDAAGRIDAVARLHRTLCYSADERIAADFLNAICRDAASFAGVQGARVACRVDMALEPAPEQLRALGLLIHELVLNALKHAHPAGLAPTISVLCRTDAADCLMVDVCDDGVGFPEDFDPDLGGGFGFNLMRQLAGQLDALLAFESTPLGLKCSIRGRTPVAQSHELHVVE